MTVECAHVICDSSGVADPGREEYCILRTHGSVPFDDFTIYAYLNRKYQGERLSRAGFGQHHLRRDAVGATAYQI